MATLGDLLVRVGITGTDEFTKTFGTMTDRLKVFDKEYNKTFAGLEKTGDRLKGLGSTLSVGITAPLAVLGGVSVKAFGDFDAAMTQSLAIMGNVSATMRDDIGNAARQMAKESTFSATQTADAIYFLASAGLDAKASIEALPVVTKFAQAGMFDLSRATDLLTDSQSALGLTIRDDATANMQNMVRVSDVLVEAANASNASVEQFAAALTNKAGAALRLVNKDIEEGVAVLAAFADQGTKGEEAGEKLSIVMRDLQNAAIGQKDEFKALNIGVFDSAGNLRNMADIVGDLEGALTGMSDEQKRTTLSMLGFQDRSVSALQSLLGFSGAIRDYEGKLRQAGGTTEEIAQKQLQTFNAQMTLMKNRLTDAAISIGGALVPVLQNLMKAMEPVIQFATNMAHQFAAMDPRLQMVIISLAALAAAAGPVLYVSGQMLTSFAAISKALGTFSTFLTTSTGGLTGLSAALTNVLPLVGLVGTAFLLWDSLSGIVDDLSFMREQIERIVGPLAEWSAALRIAAAAIEDLVSKSAALKTAFDFVVEAGGHVSDFFINTLKNTVIGPIAAIETLLNRLRYLLEVFNLIRGTSPQIAAETAGLAATFAKLGDHLSNTNPALKQYADGVGSAGAKTPQTTKAVDDFRTAVDKEKKSIIESTEKKKIHEQAMRELGLETEKVTATFIKWEEQQNSVTQTIIAGAKKQQDEFTESIKRLVDLRAHIDAITGPTAAMIVQISQTGGALTDTSVSVVDFTGEVDELMESVRLADVDFKKLGGDTLPQFGSDIDDAVKKIEALEEPFKTLGITSAASLANIAEKNRVAYEEIRSRSTSSLNDINRAWVRYEESRIEAARAAGEQIPKEQQAALDKMKRDLEIAHGGQTQQWKKFTQQVSTIINDFAKDLAAGTINLFKGLFGFDDFNRKLAKDSANLRAELDDRTQAIDEFRQTTEDAIAGVNTKYAQQLAEETSELMDALGKRQGEYAAYVVDVAQKLETLRNTESERLANEQATLSDRLRDKEADYERYVGEVARKEEDIRRTHDEQLRLQLRSLQENLADRVEVYEDFVTDANTKLGRIEGDLEETIRDATRNINRRIEDENEDFAKDQTKLNDDLRKAEAKGDTERVKDIKRQLAERESAHSKTIRRLQEDLAEQVRDARRRAEEQTTDLQTQLDRRGRDHAQYLAENTRAQEEATEKHRTQQEQQLTDLQRSLDERTAALIAFRGETAAAIATAAEASAQKILDAEREADALVVRKRLELDTFATATQKKIDELTAHYGKKQEEEVTKLNTEFTNKLKEYDTYRSEVEKKLAELEAAHKGPLGRIKELFSSVFESAANAVLRLASEEVIGLLFKKLKGLIDDVLPALGKVFSSVFGAAATAAENAADAVNNVGGTPAPTGGGGGGLGGGLGGTVDVITGAISAAANVVSAIYNVRIEGTLNAIEENTRRAAIIVEDTLNRANEFWPIARDIHASMLELLLPTLREIRDGLKTLFSVNVNLTDEEQRRLVGSLITRVGTFDTLATDRLLDIHARLGNTVTAIQDARFGIVGAIGSSTDLVVGGLAAIEAKLPSTIGNLLGGIGNLAGGISGALSGFVSGLIGGLINRGQGEAIDLIEENTRFIAIATVGPTGLVDTSRQFLPYLKTINEFNYKTAAPWMASIESHTESGGTLDKQLANIYNAIQNGSNVILGKIRDAVVLAPQESRATLALAGGGSITIHNHIHIDGNEVGNSIVTISETQGGGGL